MASLITIDSSEFAAALPSAGKLAGLDVGTRTIGLAICDAGWHFAGPAETIRRTKFTRDLEALRTFITREHVVGLVVGLVVWRRKRAAARETSRATVRRKR